MSRFLLALFTAKRRWQLVVVVLAGLAFCLSLAGLSVEFRRENSVLQPARGGTYIEGVIGEVRPWSPWFTVENDVNRDISSLVFAGLLKYEPETQQIVEDLATMAVSDDGKLYTLTLKPDIFWHDSTPESPHPVTADDVLFTFQTIQQASFPNPLLRQNFLGVLIGKVDERTVTFRLDSPYAFFPTNLTLGLVPKRMFEGITVSKLDQAMDLSLKPVGAGPYRFKSLTQTEIQTEVTLERFSAFPSTQYRLERLVFRIFPDYFALLSDLHNLDGIRLVPLNEEGQAVVPSGFQARTYTLPQYVGLFFNLGQKVLADQKLRLGLQLGLDKQALATQVGNAVIVDTPLLQIDTSDWRYQFDANAAQGALYASQWYFPEKVRLQELLEQREVNEVGSLSVPQLALLQTGAVLTLTGATVDGSMDFRLSGVPVRPSSASGIWIVTLSTQPGSTGALRLGDNLLRLTRPDGSIVDSAYLNRQVTDVGYARAAEELRLLELFIASRQTDLPAEQRVTAGSFALADGFLRLRTTNDPVGTRINDQGRRLQLRLLTSPSPAVYAKLAASVAEQWRQLGVDVQVEVAESPTVFEDRLLRRDYDVLLFGQSLLSNLDAYPYWHSSAIQTLGTNADELRLDAYNLSQYTSAEADALLETIRSTPQTDVRLRALSDLREVLKRDAPAIVLYSPIYTYAHRNDVLGVDLGSLSTHADRMQSLSRWYIREELVFKPGTSWSSFPGWLWRTLSGTGPVPTSEEVEVPVGPALPQ
jgi:ABC-type transport system substrate-binding protein